MDDTSRSVLVTMAIVLGVLFLFPVLMMAGMFPFGGMMGGWAGPGFAGSWGLRWLFPLVFWGAIITGIVFLVRAAVQGNGKAQSQRGEAVLDILKKRYARGEITREEFETMKRDLG
ncbi:MAG: SHOCT domain-containing protein [Dehalococcoidia bacterium]|nr:SHOCT domain-containing protein [Dehalococcoidia bacterium]